MAVIKERNDYRVVQIKKTRSDGLVKGTKRLLSSKMEDPDQHTNGRLWPENSHELAGFNRSHGTKRGSSCSTCTEWGGTRNKTVKLTWCVRPWLSVSWRIITKKIPIDCFVFDWICSLGRICCHICADWNWENGNMHAEFVVNDESDDVIMYVTWKIGVE